MEYLRKSACLGVALLLLSLPLAACALPGEEMTEAEQDCCLQMADNCGGVQMSDDHTCCTKISQAEGNVLKATNKYTPAAPEARSQTAIFAATTPVAPACPRPQNLSEAASPPPGSVTILRI